MSTWTLRDRQGLELRAYGVENRTIAESQPPPQSGFGQAGERCDGSRERLGRLASGARSDSGNRALGADHREQDGALGKKENLSLGQTVRVQVLNIHILHPKLYYYYYYPKPKYLIIGYLDP